MEGVGSVLRRYSPPPFGAWLASEKLRRQRNALAKVPSRSSSKEIFSWYTFYYFTRINSLKLVICDFRDLPIFLSSNQSKMSEGQLKAEKDFSKEVGDELPKAQQLAKVGCDIDATNISWC